MISCLSREENAFFVKVHLVAFERFSGNESTYHDELLTSMMKLISEQLVK